MEKICIAKMRKSMSYPGHPDEGSGCENRAGETKRLTGSLKSHGGGSSANRGADAADKTISLPLTQEQMNALRSNRSLAPALMGERATGFAALQHRNDAIVIKLEFGPLPPVRMLKTAEVMQMLRIGKSSLNKMLREGMLKSYRFGRLRRIMFTDVLSYLEDHQSVAAAQPRAPESKPANAALVQQSLRKEN